MIIWCLKIIIMIIIFRFLNKAKKFKNQVINNKNNKFKKIMIMSIQKIKNNQRKDHQLKKENQLFYKKMQVLKNNQCLIK